MLAFIITKIVRFCTRFPWPIIALALICAVVSGVYSAQHFAINTDVNKLISPDLDWRKREAEFEKAFPGHFGTEHKPRTRDTEEYERVSSCAGLDL